MEIEPGDQLLVIYAAALCHADTLEYMGAATTLGLSWSLHAEARQGREYKYAFEAFCAPLGKGPKGNEEVHLGETQAG